MVNARLHVTTSCQCYQCPQRLQSRHQISRMSEVSRRLHRRTEANAVIKQACTLHSARRLAALELPNGSTTRLELHGTKCNRCSDDICPSGNGLFGCFPHLASRLLEALAALVLVAQPAPAIAGEIIQGTPRVADGDTLQVLLCSSLLCRGLAQPCARASMSLCSSFVANQQSLNKKRPLITWTRLQIDDKKIRLFGFDAPEKAQLCKNARGADYSCGKHHC